MERQQLRKAEGEEKRKGAVNTDRKTTCRYRRS